jgi:hypothetical protein
MKIPVAAVLLLAAFVPAASAETFRCGSRVVSRESSVNELVQYCGEPQSRTSTTEDIRAKNRYGLSVITGQTVKETWVYDRGPQAAAMVVTIVDGRIKSIARQD